MSTNTLINRTFHLHERYGSPEHPVFLPGEIEHVLQAIAYDAEKSTGVPFLSVRILPSQHKLRVTGAPALIVYLEKDDRLAHERNSASF